MAPILKMNRATLFLTSNNSDLENYMISLILNVLP